MKKITSFIFILMLLCYAVLIPFSLHAAKKPLIQMAILFDTSGSMEGLIEQAKSQLWKIVNELAIAKKDGQTPVLQVGLYEYGKDSIPASEGYLRMILPLTTDLDKVSEELFALKTYGGQEYCGQVIKSAVKGLKWKKNNKDLKMIFIAGNEPFTQGETDYKKSCKNAIKKGIIVNTIFCGNHQEGINTKWKHGADLADGKYSHIDHNRKITYIKTPQDKEIMELNKKLNDTYIAFGAKGITSKARQKKQDENASAMGAGALVQRSVAKASELYDNSTWDLVDAVKEGGVELEEIAEPQLPEEMQKMDKKERKEYIGKKKDEREKIQKKIKKLNAERRKYIEKQRKMTSQNSTFDSAIIKTIRYQAEMKDFEF